MSVDLIEKPTTVAAEAIANERPSLEHDPARQRGIMLELEVRNNGGVTEGRCWVERATKPIKRDQLLAGRGE